LQERLREIDEKLQKTSATGGTTGKVDTGVTIYQPPARSIGEVRGKL
jgi:hypothetical protein